jgi:hypothetical protein
MRRTCCPNGRVEGVTGMVKKAQGKGQIHSENGNGNFWSHLQALSWICKVGY